MKHYLIPRVQVIETDVQNAILSGSGAVGTIDPFTTPSFDFDGKEFE